MKRNLTEQQLKDKQRFEELMRKEENKKLNRKMNRNKWHEVGNMLYGIGFGLLIWLLYDIDHMGESADFGSSVEFAILKFVGAIVCMGVGAIVQRETTEN